MKFIHPQSSKVTLTQLMLPSYSNFRGKIHGGYILNLMDQVAFSCASRHSGNYCVTASVNRVNFLNPIEVGELVTLKSMVNYTGRTSMVIGVRVESENIKTGEVKHCNSSYFTMVAKDEQNNNVPVPGLILDSEESIRRFVRSMYQLEQSRERDQSFQKSNFNVKMYLSELTNQNIELQYE